MGIASRLSFAFPFLNLLFHSLVKSLSDYTTYLKPRLFLLFLSGDYHGGYYYYYSTSIYKIFGTDNYVHLICIYLKINLIFSILHFYSGSDLLNHRPVIGSSFCLSIHCIAIESLRCPPSHRPVLLNHSLAEFLACSLCQAESAFIIIL